MELAFGCYLMDHQATNNQKLT